MNTNQVEFVAVATTEELAAAVARAAQPGAPKTTIKLKPGIYDMSKVDLSVPKNVSIVGATSPDVLAVGVPATTSESSRLHESDVVTLARLAVEVRCGCCESGRRGSGRPLTTMGRCAPQPTPSRRWRRRRSDG